jgi:hypothetical protein
MLIIAIKKESIPILTGSPLKNCGISLLELIGLIITSKKLPLGQYQSHHFLPLNRLMPIPKSMQRGMK